MHRLHHGIISCALVVLVAAVWIVGCASTSPVFRVSDLNDGGRDGRIVVVMRDGARFEFARWNTDNTGISGPCRALIGESDRSCDTTLTYTRMVSIERQPSRGFFYVFGLIVLGGMVALSLQEVLTATPGYR